MTLKIRPASPIAPTAQLVAQTAAILGGHLLKCFTPFLALLAKTLPVLRRQLLPVLTHFLAHLAPFVRRQLRLRSARQTAEGSQDKQQTKHSGPVGHGIFQVQ